MADNVTLNSGSGGSTVATDDIGGVHHQRVKIQHGADGSATDVSSASPLPINDASGSLTVDAPVGTPVFVRLSDGSAAISTLPVSVSGGATAANQATEITALDAIKTSVETLDNAISGSEMQVDVVAALPSGTNAIGKLAANSGVDIGDVDVTSVTPGTTAAALGKAEDAAHASGDVGVFVLGVRRDSAASGADTDGDYAALGLDSSGRLHTTVGNTVTVTGTVTAAQATAANLNMTEASAADIKTAVQIIDDWDESDRAKINLIVGQAGVAAGAGAVSATVQRVTLASDDPGVTALQIMDDWDNAASDGASVSGDVAHDAADAGEPVKQGFKATTALSALTLVANNDRTDGFAGIDGVQIVRPHCNLEDIVQERTTNTDGASTAFASGLAAPGSGVRLYIKKVTIANSSSAFCTVDLRDGAAGSVLWTIPVPANGGAIEAFDPPLRLTANTALAFDASTATTTLSISANGFKSKV